jgi:glycine oxidase
LIAQLEQPVFFQQNGTLIVWHRQDAPEARRFAQVLAQTQRDCPSLPEAIVERTSAKYQEAYERLTGSSLG